MHSKENRRSVAAIMPFLNAVRNGIQSLGATRMRFAAQYGLKTDNSQRSCGFLLPYGPGRRHLNGLDSDQYLPENTPMQIEGQGVHSSERILHWI